jgi:hypothetical protein
LSKDAIICKIIEKKYVDQSNASATPQIDVANVTIHDNFHLINMMFMDETIDMSDVWQHYTSQVAADSPFWVHVASKFNSLSLDGDPNMEGVDFLDKVHFTHPVL